MLPQRLDHDNAVGGYSVLAWTVVGFAAASTLIGLQWWAVGPGALLGAGIGFYSEFSRSLLARLLSVLGWVVAIGYSLMRMWRFWLD